MDVNLVRFRVGWMDRGVLGEEFCEHLDDVDLDSRDEEEIDVDQSVQVDARSLYSKLMLVSSYLGLNYLIFRL